MTIRRYLYVLFLISLCINSVALAESKQSELKGQVFESFNQWTISSLHVITLENNRDKLESKVGDMKVQIAANNEDKFENIISYIECVSMDPLAIVSSAVVSTINDIRDDWDTYSMDKQLEEAESWVSQMNTVIGQYQTKERELWKYYQEKKAEYEKNTVPLIQMHRNHCLPLTFVVEAITVLERL